MNIEFTELDKRVKSKYANLTKFLKEQNLTVSLTEDLTAGQIASLITDTEEGTSVFKGGFTVCSEEAKKLLGVHPNTMEVYGIDSVETAKEMAALCRNFYQADIGIGITGTTERVFAVIYYKDKAMGYEFHMPELTDKPVYKFYAADVLVDQIMELLQDFWGIGRKIKLAPFTAEDIYEGVWKPIYKLQDEAARARRDKQ